VGNFFINGVEWQFIGEIIGRTVVMFLMILLVLRLSGKRGVRQLSLFEVAIILGLGSAAGDPMFQEDIPIIYAVIVFSVTLVVYKSLTWLASKSLRVHRVLEGQETIVVREGMFDLKHKKDTDFSTMEFFTELRNQSIEHLGQVKLAVLETDGSMSVLFYSDEEVKFGLPLFPDHYTKIDISTEHGPFACMNCGYVICAYTITADGYCPRCQYQHWAKALNTERIS